MINYVAIGRRVKKYRIQANMTQSELAEKLNISVSYVSQIERGNAEVSLKRLEEIANIINTKLEYLVADSSNNTNLSDNSIIELTKSWTPEQTSTLLKIINELDECFRS